MTSARDRLRNYRDWGFECPKVGPERFVSEDEAKRLIGVRSRGLRSLLFIRKIVPCVSLDGDVGFTRESIDAEAQWRRAAGPFARPLRALELVVKTVTRAV